ncbi:hypothetical protein MR810_01845 [bacterium]|nr:hypothetical protein [bacterium]
MTKNTRAKQRSRKNTRTITLLIALLLFSALAVGGTVAWLTANATPVENTFTPSHVACEVNERFDGETKSNVNVTNTGDTEAYIRVKLVTYRVNDRGQHIGGTATLPSFTLGANWKEYGGYYYYTKPVAPNQKPETNLTNSITLTGSYNDADGGKQVIEVMAEAIQSQPAKAVEDSWGVTVGQNGTIQ